MQRRLRRRAQTDDENVRIDQLVHVVAVRQLDHTAVNGENVGIGNPRVGSDQTVRGLVLVHTTTERNLLFSRCERLHASPSHTDPPWTPTSAPLLTTRNGRGTDPTRHDARRRPARVSTRHPDDAFTG